MGVRYQLSERQVILTPAGLQRIEDELTQLQTVRRQEVAENIRQAKDLGGIDIQACSLSMDLLHIEQDDLDPLVDGVEGVTAFYLNAGEGQLVFI